MAWTFARSSDPPTSLLASARAARSRRSFSTYNSALSFTTVARDAARHCKTHAQRKAHALRGGWDGQTCARLPTPPAVPLPAAGVSISPAFLPVQRGASRAPHAMLHTATAIANAFAQPTPPRAFADATCARALRTVRPADARSSHSPPLFVCLLPRADFSPPAVPPTIFRAPTFSYLCCMPCPLDDISLPAQTYRGTLARWLFLFVWRLSARQCAAAYTDKRFAVARRTSADAAGAVARAVSTDMAAAVRTAVCVAWHPSSRWFAALNYGGRYYNLRRWRWDGGDTCDGSTVIGSAFA